MLVSTGKFATDGKRSVRRIIVNGLNEAKNYIVSIIEIGIDCCILSVRRTGVLCQVVSADAEKVGIGREAAR